MLHVKVQKMSCINISLTDIYRQRKKVLRMHSIMYCHII